MTNLINLTKARNNLSKLIEEVASKGKTYILIRDSLPQAAIIPWKEYKLSEEKWQAEVEKLMGQGKQLFKRWAGKRKMKIPKDEDALYKIIDQTSGRG